MFNWGLTFIYFLIVYPLFLSGTLEGVRKSVIAASEHALNNINILNHDGGHPRKGAVDHSASISVKLMALSMYSET